MKPTFPCPVAQRSGQVRLRRPALFLILVLPIAQLAPAQPGANSASAGVAIYSQNCAMCHGPTGAGVIGPSLQAAHNPQQVMDIVRSGKGAMPSFSKTLSAAQIAAVAAYVTSRLAVLNLAAGDLAQGGVLYRLNCAPCHRTDVRGGALAFSRKNAPALTGLNSATIAGAVRTGPGEMPAFPASILSDQDLASIVKYVIFMRKPPDPGGLPLDYYGPVAEGLVAVGVALALALVAVWIEEKGRG